MIRYVLAVILTVALFALAAPAIDRAGTDSSERAVETSISDLEAAASSLMNNEELPPASQAHHSPQRTVTVLLPAESVTNAPVEQFSIERIDSQTTRVNYRIRGAGAKETILEEPIVYREPTANRSMELGGAGKKQLQLTLEPDERGEPVIVVQRAN